MNEKIPDLSPETADKAMALHRIENIFTYHSPFGDQPQRYQMLREEAKELAKMIETLCPDSREKSLALTNLQQAIMWANASIAINEVPPPQRVSAVTLNEPYKYAATMEELSSPLGPLSGQEEK